MSCSPGEKTTINETVRGEFRVQPLGCVERSVSAFTENKLKLEL